MKSLFISKKIIEKMSGLFFAGREELIERNILHSLSDDERRIDRSDSSGFLGHQKKSEKSDDSFYNNSPQQPLGVNLVPRGELGP
jgi:hypothetical protein